MLAPRIDYHTMKTFGLLSLLLLFCLPAQAEEPVVLVTIKPLRWLVQALAPADANVQTLIPDGQSPHDFQLRPLDVARIQQSALLVWVGPGLEPWLKQIADRLPANRQFVFLPHTFHDHGAKQHNNAHADHAEEKVAETDPHIWLDPIALREQSTQVSKSLLAIYPAKADEINRRLTQFQETISVLDQEVSAQLKPVAQTGFVVYHDGYQRIVQRYHLNQRAAVWRHESIPAGAKERAALLALLNSGDVKCLFYEPEYGRDAVNGWLSGAASKVKLVELDTLGQNIKDDADAYPRFMWDMVGKMAGCLQTDQSQTTIP